MSKTITFFGASGGCGSYALKAALEGGHTCIALLRVPSKLADLAKQYPEQLIIKEGNAHNVDDVAATLANPRAPGTFVDAISFSIGNKPDMTKLDQGDPQVCTKGMTAILSALSRMRARDGFQGLPFIAVVSTTGLREKRDYPLALYPFYEFVLATPHADKRKMEELLKGSPERYALVRPSLLVDQDEAKAQKNMEKKKAKGKPYEKVIRVGVADTATGKVESEEIGYAITRQAVGKWLYDNLLMGEESKVEGKAFSITF